MTGRPSMYHDHDRWLAEQPECPYCHGVPPSSDGRTECGWCKDPGPACDGRHIIESPTGSGYHGNPIPLLLSEESSSAESNTLE